METTCSINQHTSYFDSVAGIKRLLALNEEEKRSLIEGGVLMEDVMQLRVLTELHTVGLCYVLGISAREFREFRYKRLLPARYTAAFVEVAEIYAFAYTLFGSSHWGNRFMVTEQETLDHLPPLGFLNTPDGRASVRNAMEAMDHSIC